MPVLQRNISHGLTNLWAEFPSVPTQRSMYFWGVILCHVIPSNASLITSCSSSLQCRLLCSADSQLGPWTDPASPFLSRHQHNGQCKIKPNFYITAFVEYSGLTCLFCPAFLTHIQCYTSVSLACAFSSGPQGSCKYCTQKEGVLCPAGPAWIAVYTLCNT